MITARSECTSEADVEARRAGPPLPPTPRWRARPEGRQSRPHPGLLATGSPLRPSSHRDGLRSAPASVWANCGWMNSLLNHSALPQITTKCHLCAIYREDETWTDRRQTTAPSTYWSVRKISLNFRLKLTAKV